MAEAPPLLREERDGILILTMNRPELRNAVNYEMAKEIAHAMERLDADDSLSIGIITGSGGGFSSGMDLAAFGKGSKPSYADRGFAGITRKSANKPLIAAIEGYAVAGGFEIAIACDLIVAANNVRFALPEAQRGLLAAAGALLRLPKRMPYHLVMELALTGEFIGAARLHDFGVVNRLAEPGNALEEAIQLAQRVMQCGPLAISAVKAILERQQDWTLEEMWVQQDAWFQKVANSEDAKEGAAAFIERRKPEWTGR